MTKVTFTLLTLIFSIDLDIFCSACYQYRGRKKSEAPKKQHNRVQVVTPQTFKAILPQNYVQLIDISGN
jgi:hypothetical protein